MYGNSSFVMRITIRNKFSILVIITLIIAVFTLAAVTIISMNRKGAADLEQFRKEETEKRKHALESYVDLAYQSIETKYSNLSDKQFIEKVYGLRLQNTVDLAISVVKEKAEKVHNGEITLEEAQALAIQEINTMRYDNGTGYLWINDATLPYPTMVMHPTLTELDGNVLDDPKFNCAMGKDQNLFQAMAEVSIAHGSGFVDYLWPKPTPDGLIPDVKKLSYVKLFEEWNWVVGTGIYLDDVKADVTNTMIGDIANLRYDNGEGYFWINDIQNPYPTMIMHPTQPELDGRVLDDPKYNCELGTDRNFFQVLVEKALANGSGFAFYNWPKPGSDKDEPKLSYVKYFEPLGWVIGTGAYIDNIDAMIAAKKTEIDAQINSLILTVVGVSILLIVIGSLAAHKLAHTLTSAINHIKDKLQDLSEGKSLEKMEVTHEDEIGDMTQSLNKLVEGMDAYTKFAVAIGKGESDVTFNALSEEDRLGNSLIQMRDELKEVAEKESVRKWFNEGVTIFGDILRNNNNSLEELCFQWICQLVKYLKANQGAFFLLEEDEGSDGKTTVLTLMACYAYERKKYLNKKLSLGEGLAGQAVLEKKFIHLTEIPQDYVKIRSGLGDAAPSSIIVVPVINNEAVIGVFELASFKEFTEYEIEFLQTVGEGFASTISSVKINEKTKKLLEESQVMAGEIKAQEEELRQNTEELMATQEELNRKLREVEQENEKLLEQVKKLENTAPVDPDSGN